MNNEQTIKTFLKWAGNKSSVVNYIRPYLSGTKLIEPFAGSCALSLKTQFEHYSCNDLNGELINIYNLIQKDVDDYIDKSKEYFVNGNDREVFNQLRDKFNSTNDLNEKSQLFLYLNRHCFNGLCRYNKSGKYNVPFGSYSNPYFPEKEIRDFAIFTKEKFEFTNQNYLKCFEKADSSTTIYADPPYSALTKTSDFSNYTGLDFSHKDHIELRDISYKISRDKKCTVIISNHDTIETRQLYDNADIVVSFKVKRTISSKTSERKSAPELLAIYQGKK